MAIVGEATGGGVQAVQASAVRANPVIPFAVLIDDAYAIVAKAVRVPGGMAETGKRIALALVAIESTAVSPYPQISAVVDVHRPDPVV